MWNIPASGIFPWCVNSQGVNIPLDNSLVPVRVNVLLFFLNHKYIHEGNIKKKKNPLLVCLHSSCRQKGSQHTHCKLSAWQLTKCVVIWTSLFYDQINAVKPEFCNCHLLIHRLCHSYSHVIQLQQWMKSKLFHHWQKKVMIVAHLKSADC